MISLIWLTIAFPLIGVLINGFFGRRLDRGMVSLVGAGSVMIAFVFGFLAYLHMLFFSTVQETVKLWDWITIGDFHVSISFLVDPLSLTMVLVITGVGSLIHIYAVGYMDHEKDVARFFTYLNLFVASMLVLVLSDNYLGMYVGWELVGVCSYLLIGFWYFKDSAADAGKKAFIVNRVGDFGFALGVFLIWSTFGSLDFIHVFEHAPDAEAGTLAWITALLFVGAIGKSAQLPLYVWLPDAMEGPTPVSALIHAATMVTAGVYMVVRSNVLYTLAPSISLIIAIIGGLTAIFAATMALTEFDLKRVLAYSTVSQLGYMILAVGVGAYVAAIFHLVTHAFFKALLFMGAGSVMHATHDVIDMRRLGGLKTKMNQTFLTFLIGAAALAGFPFISAGFWSKDTILAKTFEYGFPMGWLLWALGIITALLTAFYTFRAVFMTFFGEPRDEEVYEHAHENSFIMTIPLWILAILAVLGGFLSLPSKEFHLTFPNLLGNWLAPIVEESSHLLGHAEHLPVIVEIFLLFFSAFIALGGIYAAYSIYVHRPQVADDTAKRYAGLYDLFFNKYYVDELYQAIFVNPLRRLGQFLANVIDMNFIDKILVDGTARLFAGFGRFMATLQSGYIRNYVASIFIGTVIIGIYFFMR